MSNRIDHIFPIPIVEIQVDDVIINNSLRLVNKFVEDNNLELVDNALTTSFYDDKKQNFLGNVKDFNLLEVIEIESRKFMDILGYKSTGYIGVTSWFHINTPGSWFNRHDHYGALISGVVYLQVPKNSGNILFHCPFDARKITNTFFEFNKDRETPYNFNAIHYTPEKSKMFLFESWLNHSVLINESNENRIAVAFNVWSQPDA